MTFVMYFARVTIDILFFKYYVAQPFQISDNIEIFAQIFAYFYFPSMVQWQILFLLNNTKSSVRNLLMHLYVEILENFVRLIFFHKFCFMYISFVRIDKF